MIKGNCLKYFAFIPLFLLINTVCISQNIIDSLITVLKNAKEDTVKVNLLLQLSGELQYANQYEEAIEKTNDALSLSQKVNFGSGRSEAYSELGNIYDILGDHARSLENHFKALKIDEERGDKRGMAIRMGNIANVYDTQKNFPKALEFYFNALKLNLEIGNKKGIARDYSNIAGAYHTQHELDSALIYSLKALHISEQLGNQGTIALRLGNIGIIYADKKEFGKALDYYLKALAIKRTNGKKSSIAITLGNIGNLYAAQKKFTEAETYFKEALELSESIGYNEAIMNWSLSLAELNFEKGDHKNAYLFHKKYSAARDSLLNQESSKQVAEMNAKYETEKKNKELIQKDAESKQRTTERNAFIGGFALMIVLAFFIFRSYRQKQKANQIISHQKKIVDEKQKEILDSIHYAQRIQKSLLPTEKYLERNLNRTIKN